MRTTLLLALSAGTTGSLAQAPVACQEHKLFGDERRFECHVELPLDRGLPRFVALFSGGHDDTRAALKVQIAGAERACEAGSKPELEGEDGNVSVSCRLPVGELPAGRHLVTVHLRWYHAEYEGFRVEH